MARKTIKLRRPKSVHFSEPLQRWQVVQLAKYGGFSYRFIAATVLHRSVDNVTDQEAAAVGYLLRKHEVRLTDWRNGRSPSARQYARSRVRPRTKRERLAFA